eukprot:CAMPEP_0117681118 /NCGR_PEP_ID=MMETSP0804-20121206/18776_1 /TAXON_ID=1074897 /ORGANISM="Tetraselmis astigmatica, Strain CCMP880" /LENGTH=663 /DNA_ID=CAMNT_0005490783 /DNA_START=327 /DNA_END=2315 /DNA_ORIENTATION=-
MGGWGGANERARGRVAALAAFLAVLPWERYTVDAGTIHDTSMQDVICWCPSGQRGESFANACRSAAEITGGICESYFSVIQGFSGQFPSGSVDSIEGGLFPDAANACQGQEMLQCSSKKRVWAQTLQETQLWNLDSLDNEVDGNYEYSALGTGVNIYVLDTGVASRHPQFAYPQEDIDKGLFKPTDRRVVHGVSTVPGFTTEDCFGHGTAVAGVAAGKTFGVAKNATIIAVRTLDCEGLAGTDHVLMAMSWVLDNHKKPAVVQMSLTTQEVDHPMDAAAAALVKAGLTVVASAGNFGLDTESCSPARDPAVIAVGASNIDNTVWRKSNYGPDVTLFAPGTSILSAWKARGGRPSIERSDGTSVAAPHVSGAIALHLEHHPHHTPQQVLEVLLRNALHGAMAGLPEGTPNILLRVDPQANAALLDVGDTDLGDTVISMDGTEHHTVVLTNVGSENMTFSLLVVAHGLYGGWLSAQPSAGSLGPEQAVEVALLYEADGLRPGRYASTVTVLSDALNDRVELDARLLVLCSNYSGLDTEAPRTVGFLEGVTVAAHDASPPWDTFEDYSSLGGPPHVWVEFHLRFSHPIKDLPGGSVSLSAGAVVEVLESDVRGRMCGDYIVRGQVPVQPWVQSSVEVCLTLEEAAVLDVYGKPFPNATDCATVKLR